MNRKKALRILSLLQQGYREDSDIYQSLKVALNDMVLVMNVLAVYQDDSMGEDWLLVIDDIIKGFIEMESE